MMDSDGIRFRREEIVRRDIRDEHGRFIGRKSSSFLNGTLETPVVDESSGVKNGASTAGFGHIYLTHDIDQPFAWIRLCSVAKAILKNPLKALNPILCYLGMRDDVDPYDSFDWLIKQDARVVAALGEAKVTPVYFVMAHKKYAPHDGKPYLRSLAVKKLIRKLMAAGTEIGLHSSYQAGENPNLVASEKERLEKAVGRPVKWNRHHYLRTKEPEDMTALAKAGITDDFTLAYADVVGFRVGTCRPYKWHDSITGEETELTIHPLTIMECTLDMAKYMGLNESDAFVKCKKMIDAVYKYSGDLVLLWHNTSVAKSSKSYHRRLYAKVLDYIIEKGSEK